MSDHGLVREQLRSQVGSVEQRAPQVLSQAEALQLESRLLVSRALLLLSEQLSQSGTGSAPSA